ncbi:MAG TPA: FixH family protein [Ktedonobacterales bacterium]
MRIREASDRRRSRNIAGARWLVSALLALVAVFVAQAFTAPAVAAHPAVPAHALPVRTEPAADAILGGPPPQVKMWFSESLNSAASRIVVVDPTNHEVDARDSRVSSADPTEMVVGLQLLRPGAYVVVWRTQSAVDGHVTGGSFIFRIANVDGSVPPVPATLPSGNVPGAAGFGASSQTIDAATVLQTFFQWLALMCALFWVGGVFWEVWTLTERRAPNAVVGLGARLAARRFLRMAPYALGGALLADLGEALALTEQVAGAWRGVFDGHFWQATLFSGSFGVYWWMRQLTLLAALGLAALALRRAAPEPSDRELAEIAGVEQATDEQPIPSWTRGALDTLRHTPRLPMRLGEYWLDLKPLRQVEVALAVLLLFAFTMSGHAAATVPSERTYAVSVDFAHLIFSALWLGGLFYISVVLIPAGRRLPERTQAFLLAYGVPEFGVVAIVSATALALTGSLNAGVRLTSLAQFATTAYGRTLFVKIEIFLFMVAISAFHAFWLRPRLAHALGSAAQARTVVGVGVAPVAANAASDSKAPAAGSGAPPSSDVHRLRIQMEDWLRREALLGVGVLLCVALLSLFAGSLTPAHATVKESAGAFHQTQVASGYAIELDVSPAKFGANTFTVTVTDAKGRPVQGAATLILLQSLDMDMGQQTAQLQPVGASAPGVYRGQGDLTMAGHWGVQVKMLPPGAKDFDVTNFIVIVGS